ncbi:TRAFAC clade GTPase domain-containing protein [Phytomonospora endophytica]|uniref:Double-GTPase 2 domain-containing protein n=1 Tax=Phytomonospora endophytica TaxID=714109 RepID=A0A841FY19_9ACTN|nr:hypothetical protein [Phytomonospora endophytica]MBB6036860.1 hypothetical protein [Phytomonospora endophytica]GIG68106.1 hypothetical protein Pen01_44010 [Phytomonospora endophytica]
MWALIGWTLGVIAYLFVCFLAIVYLVFPLALIGCALALAAGAAAFLMHAGQVLLGRDPATRLVTPGDVAAGAVGGRKRHNRPRRDTAWANYFAVQVVMDTRAVWGSAFATNARLWRFAMQDFDEEVWTVYGFLWPLTLAGGVVLSVFTLSTVAAGVVFTILIAVAAAVAATVATLLGGALRGVDKLFQQVFKSATGCPHEGCYAINPLPAYRCPGCADTHRDLRPSRLGVLWHVCECGTRLPTTRIRAGRRLDPLCQTCDRGLAKGAGRHTDVRIPVFGGTSSGKSRFIMAAFGSLDETVAAAADGTSVEPADLPSGNALRDYRRDLTADLANAATQVELPRAVTVRLTLPGRRFNDGCLLHVFDAAGEYSHNRETNDDLAYLDHARTLAFVLDPFAIPGVAAEVGALDPSILDRANRSRNDPEQSYTVTVKRLQDSGVKTLGRRLAVIVSKADLLAGLPVAEGLQPADAEIRAWLGKHGMAELVRMTGIDFGSVGFFLVSSRHGAHGTPTDALIPLRWLLSHDGVDLPGARNGRSG